MKGAICVPVLIIALLLISDAVSPRRIARSPTRNALSSSPSAAPSRIRDMKVATPGFYRERWGMKRRRADTVQIAGRSLPDCSHACGSCSPCRLVMVSFVCASLQEAETCPMAYKCMCHNKSYPVT